MSEFRLEKDSLGEVEVPADALYQAQTARAVANFSIGGRPLPPPFLAALVEIKLAAAEANHELGKLDDTRYQAIRAAARRVLEGGLWAHFPVDVYQTGSGTSSNMNANEVLATLATTAAGVTVHPNDHVNASQSSNDVIPSAILVACARLVSETLVPALGALESAIAARSNALASVVKTGRTHLMDAMPVTLGQELGAWRSQVAEARAGLEMRLASLAALPIGGTAVGTGVNCPPGFAERVCTKLAERTGIPFAPARDRFARIAGQEPAVALAGDLNVLAVVYTKLANDLRWMNSGPNAGLGEISLAALQPGSSIMPGKVNPVLPEAVAMAAARVMGNHQTVTVAGQSGNFQLNVMLPLVAATQIESLTIAAGAARALEQSIATFEVRDAVIAEQLGRNPILVTALNERIGYERAAAIAKAAFESGRPVADVATEMTDLGRDEIARLLDPARLV